MIRLMRHRVLTHSLMGMAAMLLALATPNRSKAAISQGPHYTNSVAAEEQRILQFFQAEQSFQNKLKVGRERYDQKQLARSNIIAAMTAELQARQQTVMMAPVAASSRNAEELASSSQPWLAVASLIIGIGGLGCLRIRQRPRSSFMRLPPASRAGRQVEIDSSREEAPLAASQLTKQSTKNKSVLDLGTSPRMTLSDGVKPRPSRQRIRSATVP
jgi:hypothetical protein